MKTLFLTSSFVDTKEAFIAFAKEQNLPKEITFIPTAANVEEYRGYVNEAKELFQELGYQLTMLDVSSQLEVDIIEQLKKTDVLYVSGGNTFYLLQEFKRKHLLDILAAKVKDGMVYIGESAGAIITAPSITYIEEMDARAKAPELINDEALAFLDV